MADVTGRTILDVCAESPVERKRRFVILGDEVNKMEAR